MPANRSSLSHNIRQGIAERLKWLDVTRKQAECQKS